MINRSLPISGDGAAGRPDPDPWDALAAELECWRAAGCLATLWWRDDDAVEPTPALDRLTGLAAAAGVPLALAVVPAQATPALAEELDAGITVFQHGWSHTDHLPPGAPPDAKKSELGADRPLETVLRDLRAGAVRLAELWDGNSAPVLVPPWTRFAPAVVEALPRLGVTGLSCFGPRRAVLAAPGVVQVNVHADIIDWHGTGGFAGDAAALGALGRHPAHRRTRAAHPAQPTRVMTPPLRHHRTCLGLPQP